MSGLALAGRESVHTHDCVGSKTKYFEHGSNLATKTIDKLFCRISIFACYMWLYGFMTRALVRHVIASRYLFPATGRLHSTVQVKQ